MRCNSFHGVAQQLLAAAQLKEEKSIQSPSSPLGGGTQAGAEPEPVAGCQLSSNTVQICERKRKLPLAAGQANGATGARASARLLSKGCRRGRGGIVWGCVCVCECGKLSGNILLLENDRFKELSPYLISMVRFTCELFKLQLKMQYA